MRWYKANREVAGNYVTDLPLLMPPKRLPKLYIVRHGETEWLGIMFTVNTSDLTDFLGRLMVHSECSVQLLSLTYS